jgi:hypothetical protein
VANFIQELFSVIDYDQLMKLCPSFVNLQKIKLCRDHGVPSQVSCCFLYILVTMFIHIPVSSVAIGTGRQGRPH